MKSCTLFALIAATIASTTEAIKLKSEEDTFSRIEWKINVIADRLGARVFEEASEATLGDRIEGKINAIADKLGIMEVF